MIGNTGNKILISLTCALFIASIGSCLNSEPNIDNHKLVDNVAPNPISPAKEESLFDQQKRAYTETRTGKFYELYHSAKKSLDQLSIDGAEFEQISEDRDCMTGKQSWSIKLTPGQVLRVKLSDSISCKPFLLGLIGAKFASYRNDLQISFAYKNGQKLTWSNLQTRPGWREILLDLHQKRDSKLFDKDIDAVEISFTHAKKTIEFKLNDVLLVNNSRNYLTVKGLKIRRSGLGWSVWKKSGKLLAQISSIDGLIRLADPHLEVLFKKLNQDSDQFLNESRSLDLISKVKISDCEVLEMNSLRFRGKISWLFPKKLGNWSLAYAKKIQFFITVYPDGRAYYEIAFDNLRYSSFADISEAEIAFSSPRLRSAGFVWEAGERANKLKISDVIAEKQKFSCMSVYKSEFSTLDLIANYLKPVPIDNLRFVEFEKFDKSTGQYVLKMNSDKCRFRLNLNKDSKLYKPVFLVKGNFQKMPIVSCAGQSVTKK